MRLGKRTARLVRQAMVMGFVHGVQHGANRSWREAEDEFPGDSVIVANALRAARKNSDLYPTLAKVESVDAEADAAEAAMTEASMSTMRAIMNGSGVDTP